MMISLKKSAIFAGLLLFPIFASAKFKATGEASVILTGGNTDLKTYNLSNESSYTLNKNLFKFRALYTYGESAGIRSAERWEALLRYDRELSGRFSIFASELVEANRFAGFSRRYNTDIGPKFFIKKSEKLTSFVEASFRYTIEKRNDESLEDLKQSKARLYSEVSYKFKPSIQTKLWAEFIPNFTDSTDYLINISPSVSIALNEIFSLKLSYLWNYDNLPAPGNGKHDYTYTTGIIANF